MELAEEFRMARYIRGLIHGIDRGVPNDRSRDTKRHTNAFEVFGKTFSTRSGRKYTVQRRMRFSAT